MKINKIFPVVIFLFVLFSIKAQTTVYFRHDDSGNRDMRRNTVILKSTKDDTKQETFKDKIGDEEVLIYPNPVKSELTVEIPELGDDESARLNLYNQEGKLVLQENKATRFTILNLSDLPYGIYILNISLADKTIQWKIVKE
ncbi:MAG: T9SS type A sorting domain-containing protein [Bacteroidales bacterium]|nr:T9SS type A sorting domain-containing protein [Bacteroidales bacterium]